MGGRGRPLLVDSQRVETLSFSQRLNLQFLLDPGQGASFDIIAVTSDHYTHNAAKTRCSPVLPA